LIAINNQQVIIGRLFDRMGVGKLSMKSTPGQWIHELRKIAACCEEAGIKEVRMWISPSLFHYAVQIFNKPDQEGFPYMVVIGPLRLRPNNKMNWNDKVPFKMAKEETCPKNQQQKILV